MLYNETGDRKYLTSSEWRSFIVTAMGAKEEVSTFALLLAHSGARISEALETTPRRIDFSAQAIVIHSLKRRRPDIYRTIPIPAALLTRLELVHGIRAKQLDPSLAGKPIWGWCRTTAWSKIKALMKSAGIYGPCATPKGLRHALAVKGVAEAGVPLNIMQKWMGHARIETTAIYANALGKEERALAAKLWDL